VIVMVTLAVGSMVHAATLVQTYESCFPAFISRGSGPRARRAAPWSPEESRRGHCCFDRSRISSRSQRGISSDVCDGRKFVIAAVSAELEDRSARETVWRAQG
jgi:hypothetical protein